MHPRLGISQSLHHPTRFTAFIMLVDVTPIDIRPLNGNVRRPVHTRCDQFLARIFLKRIHLTFFLGLRLQRTHSIVLSQQIQPLDLTLRLQITRSTHRVILWQSDTYVKATILRIKLSLVQIRHLMPSFFIVYRRLWIPLRDLIRLIDMPHARHLPRWQFYPKRRSNHHFLSRRQWLIQCQQGDIHVLCIIRQLYR